MIICQIHAVSPPPATVSPEPVVSADASDEDLTVVHSPLADDEVAPDGEQEAPVDSGDVHADGETPDNDDLPSEIQHDAASDDSLGAVQPELSADVQPDNVEQLQVEEPQETTEAKPRFRRTIPYLLLAGDILMSIAGGVVVSVAFAV